MLEEEKDLQGGIAGLAPKGVTKIEAEDIHEAKISRERKEGCKAEEIQAKQATQAQY